MSLEERLFDLKGKLNDYGVDRMHRALVERGVTISNAYINGLRNGRFKSIRKDVEVGIQLVLSGSTETLEDALRRSRRPGPRPRPSPYQVERYGRIQEVIPYVTWSKIIDAGLLVWTGTKKDIEEAKSLLESWERNHGEI